MFEFASLKAIEESHGTFMAGIQAHETLARRPGKSN